MAQPCSTFVKNFQIWKVGFHRPAGQQVETGYNSLLLGLVPYENGLSDLMSIPAIPVKETLAGALGLRSDVRIVRPLYFLQFGAIGFFFTFANVYYNSIGLSGVQIGLINTLGPLAGIFSAALWGYINDRTGKPRLVVMAISAGIVLSSLLLSTVTTFALILPAACLLSFFSSPLIPLIDSTTLSLLGEKREQYGNYRVWGSVGYILTSSASGFILQRTGLHFIFYGYAVLMGLLCLFSFNMPDRPVKIGGSLGKGLGQMVRQPRWMIFYLSVFILWLAPTGLMTFLSMMLKGMGAGDPLIGLVWTIAAVTEVPAMIFSGRLLRRFGPSRLIQVSLVGFALRIFLFSIIPSPGWALAVSPLNAVSFTPFWTASVAYANDLAPDHLKSTAQGMLGSVTSLSSMAGSFISGILYDQVGPRNMFAILSTFCILALLVFNTDKIFHREIR